MRNLRRCPSNHIDGIPRAAGRRLVRRVGETEVHPVYRGVGKYIPIEVSYARRADRFHLEPFYDIHFHVSPLRSGVDEALPREGQGDRKRVTGRLFLRRLLGGQLYLRANQGLKSVRAEIDYAATDSVQP